MSDRIRPTKADYKAKRDRELSYFAYEAKWFVSGSKLSDYVAMKLSYYINKGYSLTGWADELEYNRNTIDWSDDKIESTQWQDNSSGFNDTVPFKELALYVAVKFLKSPDKELIINPPYDISKEFENRLLKRVNELISGKGYFNSKDNPDSVRVMGIQSQQKEALNPSYDLHNGLDAQERDYVMRGIRGHLKEYADNFPFGTDYEIRTYKDAKLIYHLITELRSHLQELGIRKDTITKGSSNNSKGYNRPTMTQLRKDIGAYLDRELTTHHIHNKESRIIPRATELILLIIS